MDVIRCPVSAGLNFHRTKLSQMAVEPRKPRKFRTAKIKDVASIYAHCMASKTIDPDLQQLSIPKTEPLQRDSDSIPRKETGWKL